ncbi:MAG TPA: hypothetical protein VMR98_03275, partial [Candidatus Polarisedimenticolaceae bacterium]|nr:hypothetical protein [Candidatus Polarisedimenticolaceae bacterium]
ASKLMHQATERMDKLRITIRKLAQTHDFDELLKEMGEKMYDDWHKLPDDHPQRRIMARLV